VGDGNGHKPQEGSIKGVWCQMKGGITSPRRVASEWRQEEKDEKWSTTGPILRRPPHPAPTRRPSLLSAMSARSIVRCHFVTPVFLNALHYFSFH
jgi:hypothetical protein